MDFIYVFFSNISSSFSCPIFLTLPRSDMDFLSFVAEREIQSVFVPKHHVDDSSDGMSVIGKCCHRGGMYFMHQYLQIIRCIHDSTSRITSPMSPSMQIDLLMISPGA